jgi:hypothetical protein
LFRAWYDGAVGAGATGKHDNSNAADGGGVYNLGDLSLLNSAVCNNRATGNGGGLV